MSDDLIQADRDEHILTITLNRPDKKNALKISMYQRLLELMDDASEDDGIRVVVIKGAGGNLTSGNDLADFQEVIEEENEEALAAYHFVKELALFDKLLVTQVEGYAVGVGATMLLHSDYVTAEEGSQIRFPFVDLGVVPEAGSSLLLPMMCGYQKAAEIIFTADTISPEKAYEVGFVNEVVPPGQLEQSTVEISERLAKKPPGSVQESKSLLKENYREDLIETIDREMELFHERLFSEEAMEAISAFIEDREPDFSGT
ncbi:MAG: enoyl-CoA hydratase-related protein [bacterium]